MPALSPSGASTHRPADPARPRPESAGNPRHAEHRRAGERLRTKPATRIDAAELADSVEAANRQRVQRPLDQPAALAVGARVSGQKTRRPSAKHEPATDGRLIGTPRTEHASRRPASVDRLELHRPSLSLARTGEAVDQRPGAGRGQPRRAADRHGRAEREPPHRRRNAGRRADDAARAQVPEAGRIRHQRDRGRPDAPRQRVRAGPSRNARHRRLFAGSRRRGHVADDGRQVLPESR